jgi:hypothetical protein
MRAPTPLRELGGELGRLTARASEVRRLGTRERAELWRGLRARVEPRRSLLVLGLAALAAGAVVAILLAINHRAPAGGVVMAPAPAAPVAAAPAGLPPQARSIHLGGRGDLYLWPEAEVTLPPGRDAARRGAYDVRLERGRIAAVVGPRAPDEPLAVVTPHLRVVVVGTRFSVALEGDVTAVAVEEGKVRVQRGEQTVLLLAGDSIRSDDPRLGAPAPCAGGVVERRACLLRAAAGEGLAAENALLALALLERDEAGDRATALARLREHQRRFPRGVLAPEVALSLARTLLVDGRRAEACAEAHAFTRAFPRDGATQRRLDAFCAP